MKGAPKKDIFSLTGISISDSNPLESDISIEFIHHLTIFYKKKFASQHCGLDIISHLDFQNTDFFGPYVFSCATLGEAVQKIYEVQTRLNPLVTYEMSPAEKPYRKMKQKNNCF